MRVCRSCLVKTLHLKRPFQVNNQGPLASTGPRHKFTYSYKKQKRGDYSDPPFHYYLVCNYGNSVKNMEINIYHSCNCGKPHLFPALTLY